MLGHVTGPTSSSGPAGICRTWPRSRSENPKKAMRTKSLQISYRPSCTGTVLCRPRNSGELPELHRFLKIEESIARGRTVCPPIWEVNAHMLRCQAVRKSNYRTALSPLASTRKMGRHRVGNELGLLTYPTLDFKITDERRKCKMYVC